MNTSPGENGVPPWAGLMVEEDWQFIHRFILASGSLKEMASQYGISYPTVRVRLDRLIAKLREAEKNTQQDEFTRLVRSHVIDGHISQFVAREILRAHRRSKGGWK